MKGEQHDFGQNKDGLSFGFAEVPSNSVLKEFCYRPKDCADQRTDQPHIAEQLGIDPGIELTFEADSAAISQTHAAGVDLKVRGAYDAIGDHEGCGGGAGAAVAQAWSNAIKDRREDAKQRDIPEQSVAQMRLAVAEDALVILGGRFAYGQVSINSSFEVIGG